MTNASANTKAHQAAHAASSDEFASSVKALREAEKAAAAKLEEARKEAARVEASGRENAVEIAAKAAEKAVQAKNSLLLDGRERSEKEVKEILSEAGKQAAKIRVKRLPEKDVQAIAGSVA